MVGRSRCIATESALRSGTEKLIATLFEFRMHVCVGKRDYEPRLPVVFIKMIRYFVVLQVLIAYNADVHGWRVLKHVSEQLKRLSERSR